MSYWDYEEPVWEPSEADELFDEIKTKLEETLKEIYDLSDKKVKIPMPGGAESLNVAIAASIILYEKVRQNKLNF